MKAIILCAGKGTRLRPLTHTTAKHLIPVANKPVLFYSMETIKAAGINEIGIIVSPANKEVFREILKDGSEFGLRIDYIVQEEPKGLAHAAWVAKDFIGNDSFLMYLGDNMLMEDLTAFVTEFEREALDASILLTPVKDPRRFGVAVLDNGRIVKVVEKPKEPPSNLAIIGVYLFKPVIFEGIKSIKPSWRGELEITDAIGWLIENGYNVKGHIVYGWWKDTGKPEDLIEANRKILEMMKGSEVYGKVDEDSELQGSVSIGEGSLVVNSTIRGPVIIGRNTVIKNSYIGPYTSIGDDVHIENCEIENSIVMEGSTLMEIESRIDSSIFGKKVKLVKSERKPKTIKLVVGDLSILELI